MEKHYNTENIPLPIPHAENFLGNGVFGVAQESFVDDAYVVKTYDSQNDSVYDEYKKQYILLKSIFGDVIPDAVFTLTCVSDNSEHKNIKIVQNRVFQDVDNEKIKPELSIFIEKCIDLYISTYDSLTQKGSAEDISEDNLIFGHTSTNPNPRLYFIDSGFPVLHVPIINYIKRLESIVRLYNLDFSIPQKLQDLQNV